MHPHHDENAPHEERSFPPHVANDFHSGVPLVWVKASLVPQTRKLRFDEGGVLKEAPLLEVTHSIRQNLADVVAILH